MNLKHSAIERIKRACDKFVEQHNIPPEQVPQLLVLAMRSYHNTPGPKRAKWSLKAIIDQRL